MGPDREVFEDSYAALDLEEEVVEVPCNEVPDLNICLPTQTELELLACQK